MFASASGGEASVKVLMENGGQQALSAQCNKGWNALGYAEHPGVRTLIEKKYAFFFSIPKQHVRTKNFVCFHLL